MNSSDFRFHQKLKKQMDNSQQPGINYFLDWLYSEAEKEFQLKKMKGSDIDKSLATL
jgi:hypothetical protein